MKQTLKLWIIVGILTICGTMSFALCTANDDRSAFLRPAGSKPAELERPLGSSKNPSEKKPTIERIVERGKLLVGTTGDYRPLSYQEADCSYWGFGIEMAGKIAERLGVNIEFVQTSWPTLMSDGYLCNGKTILCRADEADRYQSLADIDKPEVRVMVNPGGLNEKFALANLTHAQIIVHQKNEEIPSQVAEGNADAMITEITEAPWYVQNDSRLAAPLLNTPFTHDEIGVLMRMNSRIVTEG